MLDTELRLFCRAARWAYNALREGRTREDLKIQGQDLHGLNSRYVDEAIQWATEILASQKERLPGQIAALEEKIARTEKKRSKAERLERALGGYDSRLKKLRKDHDELVAHQKAGTVPPAIFGGRKAFEERCKGKISNAEWRARRRNRLICRGDKTKNGNPHLRILVDETGHFRLEAALSHLVEKGKNAPRIGGGLFVPPKYGKDLHLAVSVPHGDSSAGRRCLCSRAAWSGKQEARTIAERTGHCQRTGSDHGARQGLDELSERAQGKTLES
ncbi:MAG: hypothetical protein HYV63_29660 [Candidatus Schekmanbacteria bacterium]|nr:hypothetical protein [Candidatus Schekmanbacteria bacterium]